MRTNGMQRGAGRMSNPAVDRWSASERVRARRTTRTLAGATLLGLVLNGCASSPQTQPSDQPGVDFWQAFSNHTLVIEQIPVNGYVWIFYTGTGATVEMGSEYWNANIADPSIVSFSPANPAEDVPTS